MTLTQQDRDLLLSALGDPQSRDRVADLLEQAGSGAAIGGTITGATNGSILFVDPDNTFAEDPSNLYWDNTNNRLGLGTNAPTAQLHTTGSIRFASLSTGVLHGDVSGNLTSSLIMNSDVHASAGIQYSKLSLSNSIVNADINSTAGIVYSKLSLANSIVNADINAAAAIAYSKLSLTGSIVNADISNSAAIAYSKLNLALSIVNADISASAAIARSKVAVGTATRVVFNDGSTGALTEDAGLSFDATSNYITAGEAAVDGGFRLSGTNFSGMRHRAIGTHNNRIWDIVANNQRVAFVEGLASGGMNFGVERTMYTNSSGGALGRFEDASGTLQDIYPFMYGYFGTGGVSIGQATATTGYNPNQLLELRSTTTTSQMQFMTSGSGVTATDGLLIGMTSNTAAQFRLYENGNITFYTNNSAKWTMTSDGRWAAGSSSYYIHAGLGDAANPGLSFDSGSTEGFYNTGASGLGISTNGVSQGTISSAGLWTIGATGGSQTHRINGGLATNGSDVLTLTNGPAGKAGNPAGYINININGTNRVIPFW